MATAEERGDALRALRDAIDAFAAVQCEPGAVVLHCVVAFEATYPADGRFGFTYSTTPDTCSPSAALGVARQAVLALEAGLGHPFGGRWVPDEEVDDGS